MPSPKHGTRIEDSLILFHRVCGGQIVGTREQYVCRKCLAVVKNLAREVEMSVKPSGKSSGKSSK